MSVNDQGTTVLVSAGQVRVHPALGERRQQRLALGRLLARLDLRRRERFAENASPGTREQGRTDKVESPQRTGGSQWLHVDLLTR
jgi:hypothetical protein